MEKQIYFIVAVLQEAITPNQYEKFFKVFEFTKWRVYFELIDENDLELYQNPILVQHEKAVGVVDNIEDALKQLEQFIGKVDANPKMHETLVNEITRLKEKYNIS